MALFLEYGQRVAGGALLGLALLALLRPAPAGARIGVHIALFILLRDAMTPLGLWTLSTTPVF